MIRALLALLLCSSAAWAAEPWPIYGPPAEEPAGPPPTPIHVLNRMRIDFRNAVKKGRKAMLDGEWVVAQRAFHRAVDLDPQNPETLARLGRTYAKLNQRRTAARYLRKAVHFSPTLADAAAYAYELGKVLDADGRPGAALEWYDRSLALRPHRYVRKRLEDALEAGVEPPARTLEDLCEEAQDTWLCGVEGVAIECRCAVSRQVKAALSEQGGALVADLAGNRTFNHAVILEAAVLTVNAGVDAAAQFLAVRTGDAGWQLVGGLTTRWRAAFANIDYTGTVVDFALADLAPDTGFGEELTVVTRTRARVADYRSNVFEETERTILTVCHAWPTPRCVEVPLAFTQRVRTMIEGARVRPSQRRLLGTTRWSLRHRFDARGHLILDQPEGKVPARLVGTHAPEDLEGLPGARTTPLR